MRSYRLALTPLTFALAIALAGTQAQAQDESAAGDSEKLVFCTGFGNGHFVGDLGCWLKQVNPSSDYAWAPNDVVGDPLSGAARLVNTAATANGNTTLSQCLPVTAGKHYVLGGSARVAAGTPGGRAYVVLAFHPTTNCSPPYLGNFNFGSTDVTGSWRPIATTGAAPAGAASAEVLLMAWKLAATPTPLTVYFDDAYFHEGSCAGGPGSLCLNGERFRVAVAWKKGDGTSGAGGSIPFTADSGSFWFFDPSNIEVSVKVLNACSYNGRYWVFAAGATDVEVTLTVTDTKTGTVKTYKNPQGQTFKTITDVEAFATCP